MLRVATVFGTRPEAIKMAPVVHALRSCEHVEVIVIVTAQHRQMLDQVLELFHIVPDFDLDVMTENQSLPDLTAKVIRRLSAVLAEVKPDMVLVHGDTTTTFAGALAAFYNRVPVGHVEAGLRTGDRYSPWPEEMNRQLTGRLTELHFPPTASARENLLREGIAEGDIEVTGNTVIDALHWVCAELDRRIAEEGLDPFDLLAQNALGKPMEDKTLRGLTAVRDGRARMVLVTGHRRESFGAGFEAICASIAALASQDASLHFVYPVHLNPAVRTVVLERLGGLANVHLLPPLDYLPFVYLMRLSTIVLTDSGGVQEEAPGLGKPVLVMRECSERMEAVQAGTVELVGTDEQRIVTSVRALLDQPARYAAMAQAINPYGDGLASGRIVARLLARVAS